MHAALGGDEPLPSQLPYTARAEGWAARARGDVAGAQRLLFEAAGALDELPGYASQLTYEAMRAGAPAARSPPPGAVGARCDSRLVAAYAAHGAARAAKDGIG